MTSYATAQTRPLAKSTPQSGLKGILVALVTRLMVADQRYRNLRKLQETPDHLLDDIGIKRSDLDKALARWTRT